WGERWVEVTPDRSDPGFALWAWCQVQLDRSALPAGRVVVAFTFPDERPGNRRYWLLVEHGDAEVCYSDPGGETRPDGRSAVAAVHRLAPRLSDLARCASIGRRQADRPDVATPILPQLEPACAGRGSVTALTYDPQPRRNKHAD